MTTEEINNILNEYIDTLEYNQNQTDSSELKNIFSREDYFNLLNPVITLINEFPNYSLRTYKDRLFLASGLKETINDIVHIRKLTPGLVIDYGTMKTRDIILCGKMEERYEQKDVELNTIYDIASTSKLFTAISIYRLYDEGLIKLSDPITKYCPQFNDLNNTTIYDLLKFIVNIQTHTRVDSVNNFNEAENIVFQTKIADKQNLINSYTDMGALVLKYVIEKVSKVSLDEFITKTIIKPLNMHDTHLHVPAEKLERTASSNYSAVVTKDGKIIEKTMDYPGISQDPKAQVLKKKSNNAPGHAGYFSTVSDMNKLADALINNIIISQESILDISVNKCGKLLEENTYSRYFGSLVYSKQVDPENLSVYLPLSGKAFMSPGFTGTTLCVDPLNKISMSLGANRLHNRIYQIPNEFIKTNDNNMKSYLGKIVSSTFTKDKEVIVKKAMDLTLQYQFLEKLLEEEKEIVLVREL